MGAEEAVSVGLMTMTDETISAGDYRAARERLLARLGGMRRRVRGRMLIEGGAIWVAEVAGTGLLTFLADHAFRLGVGARVAMLVVAAGFVLVEFWRRVVSVMRVRMEAVALAGALGRASGQPGLAAQVATVLELPGLLRTDSAPSAVMIDRAVRRAEEGLATVELEGALDRERVKKMLALGVGAIVVPALLVGIFHATAGLWARRLFLGSREPWPQNTYLEVADVVDGRISVPRGEPYVLRVKGREGSVVPGRVLLTIRSTDRATALMKEFAKNDFRHDFAVIDQPLTLEVEGGDDDVGPIAVVPVDRPRVVSLDLAAQHPRQTSPEMHSFAGGDADLSFLVKTKLRLMLASNVPLAALHLHAESALPTEEDVRRVDAMHYAIEWTQEKSAKFEVEMVAAESGLVSLPVPISIGLKVDQPPRVTMAYSGVRPRITARAQVPLTIDARDDFGVIAADLAIKAETPDPGDAAKLIPADSSQGLYPVAGAGGATTQPAGEPLLQLKQMMDVGAMRLTTGSLVSFTARATDDCYTGRQTAKSGTVTFRIVAPEELFKEILQRQQAERVKFRKQMEEAEKIGEALKGPLDAKAAGELARRHRAFQRETVRIGGVLSDAFREMQLNGLGSPESQSLMQNNVLTPLKGFQDELVGPQVGAMDAMTGGGRAEGTVDAAKAQAVGEREDQIVGRMKTILQQMAQWDSFVDVLNQLDGIIKLETTVKETSEKLQHKESEDLFDK
jgi:hypothetical protein